VTERFHELLAEQWEKRIIRSPEWASRLGDNRFNNKLNDVSYETILKRQGETKDLLETVKEIDRSKLSCRQRFCQGGGPPKFQTY